MLAYAGTRPVQTGIRSTTLRQPFNLSVLESEFITIEAPFTIVDYAPYDEQSKIAAEIIFALPVTLEQIPVQRINNIDVLAILGNFVAGAVLVNIIISKIHLYIYWVNRPNVPLKRNEDTASFLKSCKRQDLAEVENELLHSLTFGGLEKFGVQTKHVYDYFTTKYEERDPALLQMIKENCKQFTARKRVELMLRNKKKVNMDMPELEDEDHIDAILERKLQGRSRDESFQIYASLILYELYGEVNKIKATIQQELSDQAHKARLEYKLDRKGF
mmetsp:Transcript_4523/g.10655  ORF Transcript_4523/g.10655 Transcript_4523/m.10655 type:complete len:274 (-) Transcript_4523:310-1131(-)